MESLALAEGRYLLTVYRRLLDRFGPQGWWPARTPFEVVVGAILTQSVAWTNVEKAIANLGAEGLLAPHALASAPLERLSALIRPAGYFNVKARKLKAFADFLLDRHAGRLDRLFAAPLDAVRGELLAVWGIGPETADSILLYAGGLPSFVVDAYTARILSRLLPDPDRPELRGYEPLRRFFMERLPADPALFNEYHALLVALGKGVCLKRRPACDACPLASLCRFAHPPAGAED